MTMIRSVILALALLFGSQAAAAPIWTYPSATSVTGAEKAVVAQGACDVLSNGDCRTVNVTLDQVAGYAATSPFTGAPYDVFAHLTAAQQAKVRDGTSTLSDLDLKTLIATAIASGTYSSSGGGPAGPYIRLSEGHWPSSCDWQLKKTVWIDGAGAAGGLAGAASATQIDFGTCASTPGITINRYNTLDGGTISPTTTGADGTRISNLEIKGTGSWSSGDPLANPAFYARARFALDHVNINWPAGTGIKIVATTSGGTSAEGNANAYDLNTVNIIAGAYCFYDQGSDTNSGDARNVGCLTAGLAGVASRGFLGRSWTGLHVDGYGTLGKGRVAQGGSLYDCISFTLCPSTTPGTNSLVWYLISTGSGTAWSNGGAYYPSGAIVLDGAGGNSRSVLVNPYVEGTAPISHVAAPSMVVGGNTCTSFTSYTPCIQSGSGGGVITSNTGMGGFQFLPAADVRGTYDSTYAGHDGLHVTDQAGLGLTFGPNAQTGVDAWFLGGGIVGSITGTSTAQHFGRTATVPDAISFTHLAISDNVNNSSLDGNSRIIWNATSIPSSTGDAVGEFVLNRTPSTSVPMCWMETVQGSPDTWGACPSLAGSLTTSGYTMATSRLVGRTTASAGATEEISAGSGLSLSSGSLAVSGAATASGLTMTAARLLGRTTASSGAIEEMTVGGGITLSGGALSLTSPVLSGTTSSIGGGALGAGACASGTASITGATTGMAVAASPVTYPGDGNYWVAYVSSANTITVKVCAAIAGTPGASAYNARVLQ